LSSRQMLSQSAVALSNQSKPVWFYKQTIDLVTFAKQHIFSRDLTKMYTEYVEKGMITQTHYTSVGQVLITF